MSSHDAVADDLCSVKDSILPLEVNPKSSGWKSPVLLTRLETVWSAGNQGIVSWVFWPGANIILDHIGAAYLEGNMKSLANEGRLVVIGVISGAVAQLNLAHMMVKRQSIIGSVIRSRSVEEKGEITARFKERVLPKFADRTLVPLIYTSFPLDQVAEAHRTMEESRHFGKIILKITHE
jgi:NADPH:quinone reductase-like Zn-dependent oxidoreductase